jgi:hypothetical protein
MTRPGFVLEVDDRTPALVVHEGEHYRLERFPRGTRVLYPPESLPGLPDPAGAVAVALTHPVAGDPLRSLLRPGMTLTVVVDDGSTPIAPIRGIDIRARAVEQVLAAAAAIGVDDVAIVIANGLNRQPTSAALERLLGNRVYPSFAPIGGLSCHDAATDDLTPIGETGDGEQIRVNARAAASDLVVFVTVVQNADDLATAGIPIGLAAAVNLVRADVRQRAAEVIASTLPLFTVAATVSNEWFGRPYEFGNKREWEYSIRDHAAASARSGLRVAPAKIRRAIVGGSIDRTDVTGIWSGDPAVVAAKAVDAVLFQQVVEVSGQSDVLVAGVPYRGHANAGVVSNPVLAAGWGLGHVFGSHRGTPVVREGGAVILYHPLHREFSQLQHPSYVDFYGEVLPTSTDPSVISAKFEDRFAADPWYNHLYRTSHAYHGLHPFATWNSIGPALAHCGQIVWVGADRTVAKHLGFAAASTLADALEIVSHTVGDSPSITYAHNPPHLISDVR